MAAEGEAAISKETYALVNSNDPTAASSSTDPELERRQATLSARERQVLRALLVGQSNKEIARELGIMEDTVKKHLKSVFAKLGVRRRAMVILQATATA